MKSFADTRETDLLSFAPAQQRDLAPFRAQSELGFRRVHVARFSPWGLGLRELRLSFRSLLPGCSVPILVSRYSAPAVLIPAREWLSSQGPWDFALIDGVFAAAFFLENEKLVRPESIKRVAYRPHRVESGRWKEEFESARRRGASFRAYSFGAQAHAMRNFERALLNLSDFVFCSNTSEQTEFQKLSAGPRYVQISPDLGAEAAAKKLIECLG